MRIEYNILWIEDNLEWLEPKLEDITKYLSDRGFELNLEPITKYDNRDVFKYDIIVVDLNLSNEEKGTEALMSIRKKVFTEILFYSISGESALRKEMANKDIDGVYCANRENCVEKLEALIDTTIRKTQEINNLRGLVMAETGCLDIIIRRILLNHSWDEKNIKPILIELSERYTNKNKDLDKYGSPEKISSLINNVDCFNSKFAFDKLKEIISSPDWDEIKGYGEIIKKRNILAHGEEVFSSAEKIVVRRLKSNGQTEDVTFIPDDFIEIRKDIRYFRDKFESISDSPKK